MLQRKAEEQEKRDRDDPENKSRPKTAPEKEAHALITVTTPGWACTSWAPTEEPNLAGFGRARIQQVSLADCEATPQ